MRAEMRCLGVRGEEELLDEALQDAVEVAGLSREEVGEVVDVRIHNFLVPFRPIESLEECCVCFVMYGCIMGCVCVCVYT